MGGLVDMLLKAKDRQMEYVAGQRNMTLLRPVQKDVKIFQIAEHFTTMVQGKQLIRTVTFKRGESLVLNFQMELKDLQVYVQRKKNVPMAGSCSMKTVTSMWRVTRPGLKQRQFARARPGTVFRDTWHLFTQRRRITLLQVLLRRKYGLVAMICTRRVPGYGL